MYNKLLKIKKYEDIKPNDWFKFRDAFGRGEIIIYKHFINLVNDDDKKYIPRFLFNLAYENNQKIIIENLNYDLPLLNY